MTDPSTASVDVFLELAERIKELKVHNNVTDAKALLGWVNQNGLDTVKAGLAAFLTDALTKPDAKNPRRVIEQRSTSFTEMYEALGDAGEELDTSVEEMEWFAAYLSGAGLKPRDMEDDAETGYKRIKLLYKEFTTLSFDADKAMNIDHAYFLVGLQNSDLSAKDRATIMQRLGRVDALEKQIRATPDERKGSLFPGLSVSPAGAYAIDEESPRNLAFYLAGAGVTAADYENLTGAKWHELTGIAAQRLVDGSSEGEEAFVKALIRYL
ncbi:Hypothetical protein POVN_LOCUS180 [uncultured virus]|nr:Hypothetical protein POVN_LOCUS180 [uncultured virus]